MNLSQVFLNQNKRLRSGWRFAVFMFAMVLLTAIVGGIAGAIVYYYLPLGFSENSLLGFAFPGLTLLCFSILVGWLCGKYLEDLPFRALGCWFTRNWARDLLSGLILGAASISFAVLITMIFGGTSFQLNRESGQSAIVLTLAVSLLIFVIGAAAEEAFFRGYMLQTFSRAKLVLFGIVFTSLFFGYTHNANPSANYLSFFNTVLAGAWFGAAYLKTRTLWLVFGLHLSWNWFQGAVLGINVSGISEITRSPLLQPTFSGSTFLTGGDYGIEGGIACTIALIFSTLLIWFLPILKPTEEMLALTSEEKPNREAVTN